MEISNLEEHLQESERALEPDRPETDVEEERVEAQKAQSEHPEPTEPDARDGAATGQGGPGF
jgi:uncharacterized membrane-anchored protein YhcB (DUF1043 family)